MDFHDYDLMMKSAAEYDSLQASIPARALENLRVAVEYNRLGCERYWIENGKPYYKVHPGVLPLFLGVKIDVPMAYLHPPLSAFLIRLPVEDNPLPARTILVSAFEQQMFLWIDLGERVCGQPVLNYHVLVRDPLLTIEQACRVLPMDTQEASDLTREQTDQCVRLVASVCFLATGTDRLVEPDVLSKDLARWLEEKRAGRDTSTIEQRAARRGKKGWTIGRGERLLPGYRGEGGGAGEGTSLTHQHQRSCHFRHYENGLVRFIRQTTVRPDLPPPPSGGRGRVIR